MNLFIKGCSNLETLSRADQRTLCKRFVEPILWTQVLFMAGDDIQAMILRIQETFDVMQPTFSRKVQFLNLKIEKGENKLEWAYRLQQAAEMADLETIQAQELKFMKYCQGLKPEDKLYDLLMETDHPTWEKALEIIRKHQISECVKAEIGDGKTTKHALNSVSGDTRAGSQSPKRKN